MSQLSLILGPLLIIAGLLLALGIQRQQVRDLKAERDRLSRGHDRIRGGYQRLFLAFDCLAADYLKVLDFLDKEIDIGEEPRMQQWSREKRWGLAGLRAVCALQRSRSQTAGPAPAGPALFNTPTRHKQDGA